MVQIFAIIGVVLMALEIFIPGFWALPIGVGFLLAAPFGWVIESQEVLLLVLAVCLTVSWFFFAKIVRPRLKVDRIKTNAEGLVGTEVRVFEDIDAQAGVGSIKHYADQYRALPTIKTEKFYKDEWVVIDRIEGNRVWVSRKN
jgi:membrane protein implicated in regulation of membrane protease activity